MMLKEGAAAAISSPDISNGFSCRFPSFRFSICVCNKALPSAHFLPFLKHEIKSPPVPSTANARPHDFRLSHCFVRYGLPRFNHPLDY